MQGDPTWLCDSRVDMSLREVVTLESQLTQNVSLWQTDDHVIGISVEL
jgi:hypothetical protein